MTRFATARHLSKRFAGMLSRRPVGESDLAWVNSVLSAGEAELWRRLSAADQRHSVLVGHRFTTDVPDAGRDDVAAALLHDIGKIDSGLGVWLRVMATIAGPRTARFRSYHDHVALGADMLIAVGSTARTVHLVGGTSTDLVTLEALQRADDI